MVQGTVLDKGVTLITTTQSHLPQELARLALGLEPDGQSWTRFGQIGKQNITITGSQAKTRDPLNPRRDSDMQ